MERAWNSTFLTKSQETLILLVPGPLLKSKGLGIGGNRRDIKRVKAGMGDGSVGKVLATCA